MDYPGIYPLKKRGEVERLITTKLTWIKFQDFKHLLINAFHGISTDYSWAFKGFNQPPYNFFWILWDFKILRGTSWDFNETLQWHCTYFQSDSTFNPLAIFNFVFVLFRNISSSVGCETICQKRPIQVCLCVITTYHAPFSRTRVKIHPRRVNRACDTER